MEYLTLKSPAKVNLYLKLLRKRKDGYNEILTLFHRISLCDQLKLRKKKKLVGVRISCNNQQVPLNRHNLIYKAYQLLKANYGLRQGVEVVLKKKIPVAAGLGGGSSNAANFLIGANKLFRLGLGKKELMALGAKVGSDVAFFVSGYRQALGRGRGEIVTPVKTRRLWFVIVAFKGGLSTKKVYENYKYQGISRIGLTKLSADVTMLSDYLWTKNVSRLSRLLCNDLEKVSIKLRPAIQPVLSSLKRVTPLSMVSGSGPTVFGILRTRKEASRIARRIKKKHKNLKVFVCQTY